MGTVLIAIAAFVAGFVVARIIGRPTPPAPEASPAVAARPSPVEDAALPATVEVPVGEGLEPVAVAQAAKEEGQAGKPVLHQRRKPRETTVLVCGVGSATPDEDVPANVLRCLTDLQRIVAGIIGDEGGAIDRFAGDRVIAVFTARGRRIDHAGHALEAAQRIASNVGAVSRRLGYDIRVGVGVHSGSLPVGDDGRVDEAAIGDTIDVAARLEALASEAKVAVIVSEDVLERAEDSASAFDAAGEMILPADNAAHRVFTPHSRDGAVQLDLIDLRAMKASVDQPPMTQ